ncbi:hypothetical protein Tco_0890104 [Tanacetum coccineum]
MFDDDWGLESKEVSPLGEELSLFDRPNEVERGRILEAHRLEPILQQQISQRMAPSHHDGTNAFLFRYFAFGMAFGGNTRDLSSFGEKRQDYTTYNHISKIMFQRMETALQKTRDTIHNKNLSHDGVTRFHDGCQHSITKTSSQDLKYSLSPRRHE